MGPPRVVVYKVGPTVGGLRPPTPPEVKGVVAPSERLPSVPTGVSAPSSPAGRRDTDAPGDAGASRTGARVPGWRPPTPPEVKGVVAPSERLPSVPTGVSAPSSPAGRRDTDAPGDAGASRTGARVPGWRPPTPPEVKGVVAPSERLPSVPTGVSAPSSPAGRRDTDAPGDAGASRTGARVPGRRPPCDSRPGTEAPHGTRSGPSEPASRRQPGDEGAVRLTEQTGRPPKAARAFDFDFGGVSGGGAPRLGRAPPTVWVRTRP